MAFLAGTDSDRYYSHTISLHYNEAQTHSPRVPPRPPSPHLPFPSPQLPPTFMNLSTTTTHNIFRILPPRQIFVIKYFFRPSCCASSRRGEAGASTSTGARPASPRTPSVPVLPLCDFPPRCVLPHLQGGGGGAGSCKFVVKEPLYPHHTSSPPAAPNYNNVYSAFLYRYCR